MYLLRNVAHIMFMLYTNQSINPDNSTLMILNFLKNLDIVDHVDNQKYSLYLGRLRGLTLTQLMNQYKHIIN